MRRCAWRSRRATYPEADDLIPEEAVEIYLLEVARGRRGLRGYDSTP
jgi:hypothetical protein